MRRWILMARLFCATAVMTGCSSSEKTVVPPFPKEDAERLFRQGHGLYLKREYDSAAVILERARSLDSSSTAILADLAMVYYSLGTQKSGAAESGRRGSLERSFSCYAALESLGVSDADVYERLCDIAVSLRDTEAFVRYASRSARDYPYDRQYFNLGRAYLEAGRFQEVIKTQKEAIEKFTDSPYTGGFYRSLGQAYVRVDRYQTAQRILEAGIEAVEGRIRRLRESGTDMNSSAESRRLTDDKVSMLRTLRNLYRIYGETMKLRRLDEKLRGAGIKE